LSDLDVNGTPGSEQLDALVSAAREWAEQDPDPVTRAECLALAEARDIAPLKEHFSGVLEFGTAGLRAIVGPGPARLNLATIRKVSLAVGTQLLAVTETPRVVLAYDGRASGQRFALECAAVLNVLGIAVLLFEAPTPTPVAAFAVRRLRADAGIVVTASHNPKEYNGFKLYGADGGQIIPPLDGQIAALMGAAPPATDIGCQLGEHRLLQVVDASVVEAYHTELRALFNTRAENVKVAYTALHGVGGKVAVRAFEDLGVRALHVVAEQQQPDPEFSTVAFPNPEELGVMDRVIRLAAETQCDVALATDPDADRLGVAVPGELGRWLQLSGNQVGVLLGYQALIQYTGKSQALVVQSVVSSPMLREIAVSFGARYERTLTGFKWICRPALALPQCKYVFGYEEALGYSVSASVLDKDGVSAALKFVELVAECERRGKPVSEHLFELYQRFGLWVSVQRTVSLPGVEGARLILETMNELRRNPPSVIAGEAVTGFTDYAQHAELRPAWLGAANLIELELGEKGRILVRPSGTEPKLKLYVDYRAKAPQSFAEYFERQRAITSDCRELTESLVQTLGL
jgi:phosphomannomutase